MDVYDYEALLERLTVGVLRGDRPVLFLTGSALSAPTAAIPGVPGIDGVIDLIRGEFEDPGQLVAFQDALNSNPNRYQAAFSFLLGRRGQQAVNEIIKRAVWKARKPL